MNSGSRNASTYGFKLNFLTKLQNTKTQDNRTNMLHFLADLLETKHPQWVNFKDDLKSVSKARRVCDDQLSKQLRGMKKSLGNLKRELEFHKTPESLDDQFGTRMSAFLEVAEDQYNKLETAYQSMGKYVTELITYYGEDPKKTNIEDFFSDIITFCNDFEAARAENAKIRDAKKREEKQKEMKEMEKMKREKEKETSKGYGKILDDQGEGEGVLDDILIGLKTGKAYRDRPVRTKQRQPRDGAKGKRSNTGLTPKKSDGDSLNDILTSTPAGGNTRTRSRGNNSNNPSSRATEALERVKALVRESEKESERERERERERKRERDILLLQNYSRARKIILNS
eukprot:sb/3466396/